MTHQLTDGRPCARPDGHTGAHYSLEAMERRRDSDRRRKEMNRDAINERARQRRQANPEKFREAQRRYIASGRSAENSRRWRAANIDKSRALTRESLRRWREANPEAVREASRRSRQQTKDRVFDHYGRSCACCGTTEKLTIDHVGGGGTQHRVEVLGRNQAGAQFYAWLVRTGFPEGFQTLCRRCNTSKHDGGRCRLSHQEAAS